VDESEKNASKFVVAGGHAAEVLRFAEEVFDLVAKPVKPLGMRDCGYAITP